MRRVIVDLSAQALHQMAATVRAEAAVARSEAWTRVWRSTGSSVIAEAAGRAAFSGVMTGE